MHTAGRLQRAGYNGWQRRVQENEAIARIHAGEEYFRAESFQAAIREFNTALRLTTDSRLRAVARRNIAISYIKLGNLSKQNGRLEEAISYYAQASTTDETYPEAYLYLGNALYEAQRYEEAIHAWARASQLAGDSQVAFTARYNTAIFYFEQGQLALLRLDIASAKTFWRKAIETAPGTDVAFKAQKALEELQGDSR